MPAKESDSKARAVPPSQFRGDAHESAEITQLIENIDLF
jgi:hypothetical protein